MGWGSGCGLMGEVIAAVYKEVTDDAARQRIYAPLIKAFEAEDCDTLDECRGADTAFDRALDASDAAHEAEYAKRRR